MAVLAGCGGDGGGGDGEFSSTEDADQVLDRTFSRLQSVESGVIDAQAELRIESDDFEQAQGIRLSGPFTRIEQSPAPRFAFDVTLSLERGDPAELELTATPDGGFLTIAGKSYRADAEVFERFDRGDPTGQLDPRRWFVDPVNEGAAEIDGAEVKEISGDANAGRLIGDLARAVQQIGIPAHGYQSAPLEGLDGTSIRVFAGEDDLLRRLEFEIRWSGEMEGSVPFAGTLGASVELAAVNEEQEIEEPADPRPIDELGGLPFELFGLGEFLGASQEQLFHSVPGD